MARALAADPPVLLMDEPFGAIDPIARDRLQAEFLRLQAELRKTVVFVTHDIDEAVRLGDRIAILRQGGVLEQYDTPAEVLGNPASPFVADFVGADRGLKRLSVTPIDESGDLARRRSRAAKDTPDGRLRRHGGGFGEGVVSDARRCASLGAVDAAPSTRPSRDALSPWVTVLDGDPSWRHCAPRR